MQAEMETPINVDNVIIFTERWVRVKLTHLKVTVSIGVARRCRAAWTQGSRVRITLTE